MKVTNALRRCDEDRSSAEERKYLSDVMSESNKRSSEDVMKIIPPLRNGESNKRSSEDVMKIVPPAEEQ